MTGAGDPLDVPCAGCGAPTPYAVGDRRDVGSFGEHLVTPLGFVYRRTHWTHSCVLESRHRCKGQPVQLPPTDEERKAKQQLLREVHGCRTIPA